MSEENIFADGLFYNDPREGAPEFVLGSMSVQVEQFIAFLNEQEKTEKGYVKLDVLRSQAGKPYVKLNTWKPDDQAPVTQDQVEAKKMTRKTPAPKQETLQSDDVDIDDIPF